MPCLFALCVFKKYLLQNSLLHNSQYASGLNICTLPPADRGGALDEDDIGMLDGGIFPLNGEGDPG